MNLFKKIISLSLIASLSINTVSADVLSSALQNYTPPSQTTLKDSSGNAIKTMYYSGGYYYRFNNSDNIEPLWSFTPPKIEAGCNGFNLKGMFISLLGLDQFGAMLQNAGTTLAWGIAVGLVYSLPGIFNVFKTLNQWAKQIQALLGSACEAGIAIGTAIGESMQNSDIGKGLMDSMDNLIGSSNEGGSSPAATQQKGTLEKITESFGYEDGTWTIGSFKFGGIPEIDTQGKQRVLKEIMNKSFGNPSIGGSIFMDILEQPRGATLKSQIVNQVNSNTGDEVVMSLGKLIYTYDTNINVSPTNKESFIVTTNITDLISKAQTEESKQKLGLSLLSYAIFYSFVGDVGYTQFTLDSGIKKLNDAISSSLSDSEVKMLTGKAKSNGSKEDEKAAQDKIVGLLSGKIDANFATPEVVNSVSGVKKDEIKAFILNGQSAATNISNKSYKVLSPELAIFVGKDGAYKHFIVAATQPSNRDNIPEFFGKNGEFPGVIAIARCATYEAFKDVIDGGAEDILLGDVDSNGNVVAGGKQPVSKATCQKYGNLNFVDLSIFKDILSKATKVDQLTAIDHFRDVMIYQVGVTMLNQMQSMLRVDTIKRYKISATSTDNTPDGSVNSGGSDKQEILLKQVRAYQVAINEAKEDLAIAYPNGKSGIVGNMSFMELTKFLEQKQKERASSNQE